VRIEQVEIEPLSVPLREPFVIASGRVEATRAALVTATLRDEASGARHVGLGEAAALPPVTHEDQPDLLDVLPRVGTRLRGTALGGPDDLAQVLDDHLASMPVARAGLECALLDAMARLHDTPLHRWLRVAAPPRELVTDITVPICPPGRMAELAAGYARDGFSCFKIKVGKDRHQDLEGLRAIHQVAPHARLRLDANEGFTAHEALELVRELHAAALPVECLEQPCGADDLRGMAAITSASPYPVVADESVRTLGDLQRVVEADAAHGVNLKLAKSGGLLTARAIGLRARERGLRVMVGGMVETRLGMSAMAHLAWALGGVDYVDLDTAWLLTGDPFEGGYEAQGPRYHLPNTPGLGVRRR
jgi:L-alanine-DL-glutamate epimerase-like enolase superfamily enzyme